MMQVANIKGHKKTVCMIAFAIAFLTNIIPAKIETSLILAFETNGMTDPYHLPTPRSILDAPRICMGHTSGIY